MTENPSVESVPSEDDLDIEISRPNAQTVLLRVAGDVDPYTGPSLEGAIADAVAEGVEQVVVDLSRVKFMDSSGLRVILSANESLTSTGVRFTLRNLSEPVHRLLEITDLLTRLDVEP